MSPGGQPPRGMAGALVPACIRDIFLPISGHIESLSKKTERIALPANALRYTPQSEPFPAVATDGLRPSTLGSSPALTMDSPGIGGRMSESVCNRFGASFRIPTSGGGGGTRGAARGAVASRRSRLLLAPRQVVPSPSAPSGRLLSSIRGKRSPQIAPYPRPPETAAASSFYEPVLYVAASLERPPGVSRWGLNVALFDGSYLVLGNVDADLMAKAGRWCHVTDQPPPPRPSSMASRTSTMVREASGGGSGGRSSPYRGSATEEEEEEEEARGQDSALLSMGVASSWTSSASSRGTPLYPSTGGQCRPSRR